MIIHFITPLYTTRPDVSNRKLFSRPKRQLVADFVVEVDGKRIVVPKGYVFDGSSIPRFLWIFFPPSYDPAWRAAAVHDFFYTHLYTKHSKQYADEVFYRIMLKDGANPFVARMFYKAVSFFGKGGW